MTEGALDGHRAPKLQLGSREQGRGPCTGVPGVRKELLFSPGFCSVPKPNVLHS